MHGISKCFSRESWVEWELPEEQVDSCHSSTGLFVMISPQG